MLNIGVLHTDSSKYRAHPICIGDVLFCVVTMPFGIGGQIPRLNAKASKRVILKVATPNHRPNDGIVSQGTEHPTC
jgi:hypothetical protein